MIQTGLVCSFEFIKGIWERKVISSELPLSERLVVFLVCMSWVSCLSAVETRAACEPLEKQLLMNLDTTLFAFPDPNGERVQPCNWHTTRRDHARRKKAMRHGCRGIVKM